MFDGYTKKGELVMTKKRTEAQHSLIEVDLLNEVQSLNPVDLLWDGWVNSFKTLQGFQTEIDVKSLQAVDNQKGILNSTRGMVSKIEEEASKKTEELNASLQHTINTIEKDQVGSPVSTWLNQIGDINNSVQALSWTPTKVMMDLVTHSQNQFESSVRKTLNQQQQVRSEVLKSVEKFTEQMKQTHKELIPNIQ